MKLKPIRETTVAGLLCRVVEHHDVPEGKPAVLCVLCHGYGAPGTDLVGLGGEVLRRFPALAPRVRFVFPEAPNVSAANPWDGKAWWEIDLEALDTAMRAGKYREMQDSVPDGMPAIRKKLHAAVDELLRSAGLPSSKLVLGGFSQGAMLTTDLTLRLEEAPGGLAIFSGTLLAKTQWQQAAPRRRGLLVVQSHGRSDPLLPFSAAEALRDLLVEAGLVVDFLPFDGPHTIPELALDRLGDLLRTVAES